MCHRLAQPVCSRPDVIEETGLPNNFSRRGSRINNTARAYSIALENAASNYGHSKFGSRNSRHGGVYRVTRINKVFRGMRAANALMQSVTIREYSIVLAK